MHPAIAALPNALYYAGRLRDHPSTAARPALAAGLWAGAAAGPVIFVDTGGAASEARVGTSLSNGAEAGLAVALRARVLEAGAGCETVGIITFYQVATRRGGTARGLERWPCDICVKGPMHCSARRRPASSAPSCGQPGRGRRGWGRWCRPSTAFRERRRTLSSYPSSGAPLHCMPVRPTNCPTSGSS